MFYTSALKWLWLDLPPSLQCAIVSIKLIFLHVWSHLNPAHLMSLHACHLYVSSIYYTAYSGSLIWIHFKQFYPCRIPPLQLSGRWLCSDKNGMQFRVGMSDNFGQVHCSFEDLDIGFQIEALQINKIGGCLLSEIAI